MVFQQQIHQQLEDDSQCDASFWEGQSKEEEVHGGVEAPINPDGCHDGDVGSQDYHVHQGENQEKQNLQLFQTGESQQEKLRHSAFISSGHD